MDTAETKTTETTEPVKPYLSFRPINDRVIILADEVEQKTAGGIIIPDTHKEKPSSGIVIAVGPGRKNEPTQLKPQEKVLFSKFSGTDLEFEGVTYKIMREDEILTIY